MITVVQIRFDILNMILLLTIVLLTIGYLLISHLNYWKKQNVVGPKPLPFFGNMLEYFLAKKHYGEIYAEIYKYSTGFFSYSYIYNRRIYLYILTNIFHRKYEHAAYVGFYRFGTPSILIRDLDLVKSILVENFNNFRDNDFKLDEKLDPLMSVNSFFAIGDKWKIYRNQLSPLLTAAKVIY